MTTVPQDDADHKQPDPYSYRAKVGAIAYARPGGEAMIQLEQGERIRAVPTRVAGWLVWIEDGGTIGYIRLSDLERVDVGD